MPPGTTGAAKRGKTRRTPETVVSARGMIMFMYGPGRYRGVLDPATDRLQPLGGVNSCALHLSQWVESRPRRRPWVVSGGGGKQPSWMRFSCRPCSRRSQTQHRTRQIQIQIQIQACVKGLYLYLYLYLRGGWRVSRTASAHVATAAPPADAETPASEAAGEPESHGARRHGADSVEDDSSGHIFSGPYPNVTIHRRHCSSTHPGVTAQ